MRRYEELSRLAMEQLDRAGTIVLIPVGSLEQHGSQCPLGTDSIIASATARRLGEALGEDFPLLAFPTLPIGLSTEHRDFCGSVTLKPNTLYALLHDICESLARHGFKKLALLNCHGGNAPILQVLSRELRSEFGIAPFVLNTGAFFGDPAVKATVSPDNAWDFHGGEMETSLVMAERPELVELSLSEPGLPAAPYREMRSAGIFGAASLGWLSQEWLSPAGKPIGIGGDPRGASAEKGEVIFSRFVEGLSAALREIRDFKDPLS